MDTPTILNRFGTQRQRYGEREPIRGYPPLDLRGGGRVSGRNCNLTRHEPCLHDMMRPIIPLFYLIYIYGSVCVLLF